MLPEALYDTYNQYKSDTNKIVQWLASTATKCGYRGSAAPAPAAEPAKPTKLKGRARKLARDAANAETAAKGNGPVPLPESKVGDMKAHRVELKEFVPMAEAIAKSSETTRISTGLIKLFRRCIMKRTGVAQWFKAEDEAHESGAGGHVHFVEVLQQTLQVLIPVHELQQIDKKSFKLSTLENASTANGTMKYNVTNAFGKLEIEETDEIALANVPDATPVSTAEAKQPVQYEVEEDVGDWFYALDCLFKDIHDLLNFVTNMWGKYLDGKLDVAVAAVATNTAIDLVRRAEQSFLAETKSSVMAQKLESFREDHICWYYFTSCCMRDGEEKAQGPSRETLVPLEQWEQVEESMLLVLKLIETQAGRIINITRAGWIGTYDPKLDYDTASTRQLYEQDCALLMDMLVTLRPLCAFHQTPNDDELMKGLYEQLTTQEIPLWLVFACKVFLEIHHVLGTQSQRPFRDLSKFALEARRTLRGHVRYSDKHGLVGYRSDSSEANTLELLGDIEEWVLNDKILDVLNKNMGLRQQRKFSVPNRISKVNKVRVWEENEVLKMSPLLCGMWKYAYHLRMQKEGLQLINESQTMIAAHLYNALHQNGYLDKECTWGDAEYLLQIHADADPFLGERPTTVEDCMRRLALSQGVSPETFARSRRRGGRKIVISKDRQRLLRQSTPVAGLFWDRFLGNGDLDLSLDKLKIVLGPRARERRKMDREHTKKMLKQMLKDLDVKDSKGKDTDEVHNTKHKEQPFHTDQEDADASEWETSDSASDGSSAGDLDDRLDRFVNDQTTDLIDFSETLAITLQLEQQDLEFDYFSFHQSTWRLLTAIQEKCLPYLLPYVTHEEIKEMLSTDEGVALVPQALMALAADPAKDAKILITKVAIFPLAVDTKGMQVAGEVMKEFIEREGDAFIKRMEGREEDSQQEEEQEEEEAGGYSGTVGRVDGVSVEESVRRLRSITHEDVMNRAMEQQKVEKEKKEKEEAERPQAKASKKARKKAKKNAAGASEEGMSEVGATGNEDVQGDSGKEKRQPQVEEADD